MEYIKVTIRKTEQKGPTFNVCGYQNMWKLKRKRIEKGF